MQNTAMGNPYEVLECSRYDTIDEIKRNHRRLVLLYHPDKNADSDQSRFIEVQNAYTNVIAQRRREQVMLNTLSEFINQIMFIVQMYFKCTAMKTKAIVITLDVTLEEIVKQEIKRIVYRRYTNGKLERDVIYIDLSILQCRFLFKGLGDENAFTKVCGDVIVDIHISQNGLFDALSNLLLDEGLRQTIISKIDCMKVNTVAHSNTHRPSLVGDCRTPLDTGTPPAPF